MADLNTEQLPPTPGDRISTFFKRADVRRTSLLWVFFTAVFVILGMKFYPQWMPEAMSKEMKASESIMVWFTVISAPIAGIVLSVAMNSFLDRHKGDSPPADGPAIRTNGPVVVIWTIVSGIFCLVAIVWGIVALNVESTAAAVNAKGALVVEVTGSQWVWSFKYPELGVESDRLMLPKDRPVKFEVTSADVNHSFWPVQLGVKVDANRLQITEVNTTPDVLGPIDVKCAELCGLYHAYMETTGEVMTPAKFDAWVLAQGGHSA